MHACPISLARRFASILLTPNERHGQGYQITKAIERVLKKHGLYEDQVLGVNWLDNFE